MSPTRAGRGAREAVFRLLIESARADLTRWRHADMGLTLSAEGRLAQLPYASSESAVELFELQAATGEGPAVTAATEGLPVIVDLTRQRPGAWVTFAGEAQRRGITSICAVPLVAGAVRLGALTAHRQRADPADPPDAPEPAPIIDEADLQRLYRLADELLLAVLAPREGESALDRFTVGIHQAAGMISVQLGVGIDDAVAALQAHAFAANRPVEDVARAVIARRLRFGPPGRDRGEPPD